MVNMKNIHIYIYIKQFHKHHFKHLLYEIIGIYFKDSSKDVLMKILTFMYVKQHTLTPCTLSQTTKIFMRWPEEKAIDGAVVRN